MERWLSRWAPLASLPAAALIVVAMFSGGGNSPGDNASVAQVVRFYTAHATGQKVSALTGTLGLVFFVFFALGLSSRVRAGGAGGWLANGAVGGAVFAALGFLPFLTFSFILGNDIKFLLPATAQTLNVLDNDYFLPTVAGFVVFGIATGLAVAVSRTPARWMGWLLVAIGIICAIPPIAWFAMLATFLWALIAGVWLAVRGKPRVSADQPEPTFAAV